MRESERKEKEIGATGWQPLPNLPHELIVDILSRLPVKSLLRFRSVCKLWLSLISDPQFVKTHLNRANQNNNNSLRRHMIIGTHQNEPPHFSSVNYETLDCMDLDLPITKSYFDAKVLASCNGLLLVDINNGTYCLWNPSTRLYKKFPGPYLLSNGCSIYGLGCDYSINNYKVVVVRIPRLPHRGNSVTEIKLYDCMTDCWRKIEEEFPYVLEKDGQGVVANGAPHWVVGRKARKDYVIIYFDLVEEKFKEVPTPNWFGENSDFHFGGFGGSLCLVSYEEYTAEVWVMKESWTNLFILPKLVIYHSVPLWFTKNGELVGAHQCFLTIYNLKKDTFNVVMRVDNQNGFRMAAYVESLVSPMGGNRIVGLHLENGSA